MCSPNRRCYNEMTKYLLVYDAPHSCAPFLPAYTWSRSTDQSRHQYLGFESLPCGWTTTHGRCRGHGAEILETFRTLRLTITSLPELVDLLCSDSPASRPPGADEILYFLWGLSNIIGFPAIRKGRHVLSNGVYAYSLRLVRCSRKMRPGWMHFYIVLHVFPLNSHVRLCP